MLIKCPGQDMQEWGADAIFDVTCSACETAVEFFKDEVKRTCPECGKRVLNDRIDLGCAEWCPQAAACVGPKAPELTDQQRSQLADALGDGANGS